MTAFGQNLRREREMRGVSLDEMAESTKIGTRLLKALEDEQFDLLPGGIFNKGFVRAYAKYLGIDEEAAVASYLEAAGQQEMDVRLVAEQNAKWERTGSALDTGTQQHGGFPVVPVLILVVIVAAGFGGWRIYQQRQQQRERAPETSSETSPPSQATAAKSEGSSSKAPAGTSSETPTGSNAISATQGGSPGQSQPSASATGSEQKAATGMESPFANPLADNPETKPAKAQPFEVSLHTKDRAWVSIKIDGEVQTQGVLGADETRNFHASRQIVLWTGNAGAVDVAYNGRSVPLEGGPNDVKVLVFTPAGVSPGVVPKPKPKPTPSESVPQELQPQPSQAPQIQQ